MRRFLQTAHPVWRVAALVGLLACLVGASAPVQAQELDLAWAVSAGGSGEDYVTRMAADGAGNSYVTGFFDKSITFGKGEAYETRLQPLGLGNIFVAKYDRGGYLQWVRRIGGVTPSALASSFARTGLAVDQAGNSYVAGNFIDTATFETGEAQAITLTSAGGGGFIATYAPDGRLREVRQVAVFSSTGELTHITVDGSGNLYIMGYFWYTVTFETREAQPITLTTRDAARFVAKYAPDGRLGWVRQSQAIDYNAITVDEAGNSYITGSFHGTATFGAEDAPGMTLPGSGMFLATYDSNGELRWLTRTTPENNSQVSGASVAVDEAGNSYVTGNFRNVVTFGT